MQLRKLASTAIGALLAGASFAVPALGATLDDLPGPFVAGGEADFVVVVGADAKTADVVGAVDIAARFGGETVETESVSTGDGEEDVDLGEALSVEFGTVLDDDDVPALQDTTLSFDAETWDVHDEIKFGSASPSLETSLTSNEEDYKSAPVMEVVNKGDIGYYYVFDEAINLSARVDSSTELEIDFLGKDLTITAITDADTITARVGEEINLDAGQSATVEGKSVKLIKTSDSDAQVEVDGKQETISEGSTKTVNGLEVKVDTIFNDDGTVNDSAVLIVGENADESLDDDEEYIDFCTTGGDADCDEDDPDWVWDLGSLTANAKGDTTAAGGPTIGVINDFIQDSPTKKPLVEGESLWLPHDFASITLKDLLADDYVKVTIEFTDAIDVDDADGQGDSWGTSEDGFVITTDVDEALVLDDSESSWTNAITADVSSKKIALIANDTDESIDVFYWGADNKETYAGNISVVTQDTEGGTNSTIGLRQFGFVDYKDTIGTTRVTLVVNVTGNGTDNLYLGIYNNDTEIADRATDNLWIRMGDDGSIGDIDSGTNVFNALGATADTEEASELTYGSSTNSSTTIGTRDEDQATAYGIKVGNPDSNGASDRVVLWVPGDRQEIRVSVGTEGAAAAGDRTGQIKTSVGKLDTEVSSPAGENNLILVGGPCANLLVAQLADAGKYDWTCDDLGTLPAGSGYSIDIVNDAFADGQVALVVVGVSADDTRDAASRVQTFDTDGLTGTSVRTGVLASTA